LRSGEAVELRLAYEVEPRLSFEVDPEAEQQDPRIGFHVMEKVAVAEQSRYLARKMGAVPVFGFTLAKSAARRTNARSGSSICLTSFSADVFKSGPG
jgi:hypothetical protein